MRLVIQDNADQVSDWSARYVLKRIKDFNPGPDNYFVLGLPTGKKTNKQNLRLMFLSSPTLFMFRRHSTWHVSQTDRVPPPGKTISSNLKLSEYRAKKSIFQGRISFRYVKT